MSFSSTASCSVEKWNKVYNNLFKPVIENTQFGYECRRSELENGSFTKEIIQNNSLNNTFVSKIFCEKILNFPHHTFP